MGEGRGLAEPLPPHNSFFRSKIFKIFAEKSQFLPQIQDFSNDLGVKINLIPPPELLAN